MVATLGSVAREGWGKGWSLTLGAKVVVGAGLYGVRGGEAVVKLHRARRLKGGPNTGVTPRNERMGVGLVCESIR